MLQPGQTPRPAVPRWRTWLAPILGLLTLAVTVIALFQFANSGQMAKTLAIFTAPHQQLIEEYQGQAEGGGLEYVIMAAVDVTPESRDDFLLRNSDVGYLRDGFLDGTLVVKIPSPARQRAAELRKDPFVSFVLSNRLGMFCH